MSPKSRTEALRALMPPDTWVQCPGHPKDNVRRDFDTGFIISQATSQSNLPHEKVAFPGRLSVEEQGLLF
ncbi:MAG: hypothetical protein OK457_10975 [Thaumarchaeota archaeon]|nr:hypothetical protein [Nitrososphaerota archaeon]